MCGIGYLVFTLVDGVNTLNWGTWPTLFWEDRVKCDITVVSGIIPTCFFLTSSLLCNKIVDPCIYSSLLFSLCKGHVAFSVWNVFPFHVTTPLPWKLTCCLKQASRHYTVNNVDSSVPIVSTLFPHGLLYTCTNSHWRMHLIACARVQPLGSGVFPFSCAECT